jgi:DUF4097 and DUF4098 domain-containing protein YvlB
VKQVPSRPVSIVLACAAALALDACELTSRELTGTASESWTHAYPISSAAEVSIVNTNGPVEVEAMDAASVEIQVERRVRATTDAAARDMLSRVVIAEDAKPERVSIETQPIRGLLIGVQVEVRYRARVPRSAHVIVRTGNGGVTLTGLTTSCLAHSTNGGITGRGLSGAVEAGTTNGNVAIDLSAVGPEAVRVSTTNGSILLRVPEAARANLTASCTNGRVEVAGLKFEFSEPESRNHAAGRINGGGAPLELTTTNGSIRVHALGSQS